MVGRVAETYTFTGVTIGCGEAVVDSAGLGNLFKERLGQVDEVYATPRECTFLVFPWIPFFNKVYVWRLRAHIVIKQESLIFLGTAQMPVIHA